MLRRAEMEPPPGYALVPLDSLRIAVVSAASNPMLAASTLLEAVQAPPEFWTKVVAEAPHCLENAPAAVRADRVVAAAVEHDDSGFALADAAKPLQADRALVLRAVNASPHAFGHAAATLREDRDFVLDVVKTNGAALEYADPSLQEDKAVVLAAVRSDGV